MKLGGKMPFFAVGSLGGGRWMPEMRASPFTSMGNGCCKTPCPKPPGLQAARRSVIIAEKLHFFER